MIKKGEHKREISLKERQQHYHAITVRQNNNNNKTALQSDRQHRGLQRDHTA